MKLLALVLIVLFSSCKMLSHNQGGSGGGGGIPSADQMDDYINKMTIPEDKSCGDVIVDDGIPRGKIIIHPNGVHPWKEQYNDFISEQFDKNYMKPMQNMKISEDDLNDLDCKGYNTASKEDKKRFWQVFMSAIAKPESGFKPNETYNETDGTVSSGLLQIDWKSAERWCGQLKRDLGKSFFSHEDMFDPKINLQCGLLMMQQQTLGAPLSSNGSIYQSRPRLVGRLFATPAWYWAVLDQGKRPQKANQVKDWFKVHAHAELPFCAENNLLTGKKVPFKKNNFETMNSYDTTNPDTEEREINPNFGEKRNQATCDIVNQSNRNFSKEGDSIKVNDPIEAGDTINK